MLELTVKEREYYIESPSGELEFYTIPGATLKLEHSLKSVSKWEQKWHKPFLDKRTEKTKEEMLDYVRCMSLDDIDCDILSNLGDVELLAISDYIKDKATASWISDEESKGIPEEIPTNELIYSWMAALHIPFIPCEEWNLNHLMALIRVINYKNTPPKKMSEGELLKRQIRINKKRREEYAAKHGLK